MFLSPYPGIKVLHSGVAENQDAVRRPRQKADEDVGKAEERAKEAEPRAKQLQSKQAEEVAKAEWERVDRLRAAAPRFAAPKATSQPKATATSAQTVPTATTGRKIRTEL